MKENKFLFAAGCLTLAASFAHVLIIFGGPDWYRFFGAGEEMARMAEEGSSYPGRMTAAITLILAVWGFYAFSGAKIIRRLPLLRPVLWLVTGIFLLRGIGSLPLLYFANDPYMNELKDRPVFMILTSAFCLILGLLYLFGIKKINTDN